MSNAHSLVASPRASKSPSVSSARPMPFAVADVSALAKSLRAALQSAAAAPTQVQMLNWLAKAAGHRNFQSFRAQADVLAVSASMTDARKAITKSVATEKDAALSAHAAKALTQFDDDGKLSRWPYKFAVQRIAMWALWLRFDAKRRYSEKEVNGVLNAWATYGDHATLRREMINMNLLARKPDCSEYWKVAQQPGDEVRAFLRAFRAART